MIPWRLLSEESIPIDGCTLVEARPRARLGTFQEAESKARFSLWKLYDWLYVMIYGEDFGLYMGVWKRLFRKIIKRIKSLSAALITVL